MFDRQPAAPDTAARALRRGRRRLAVGSLIVAIAIALVAARRADAGSYVVSECAPANVGHEATAERSTDNYRFRARCADSGEGLEIYHAADSSALNHYGAWVWRAPAGTVFTSLQVNASLTNQAGHHANLTATTSGGRPLAFGSEHADFRIESLAGEFSELHAWLRCAAPGPRMPCGRAGDDGAHVYVRAVFLRTDDRAAPTVRLTGGTLFDGEVVRGVRSLAFDAADVGGGIRAVSVDANGTTLASDVRNCALAAGFAAALRPCPPATGEATAIPTAGPAFKTGPNTVTACVEDLALDGPPNRSCQRATVWVDNLCPGSSVGEGSALAGGFGALGSSEGTARSDEPAVVGGRIAGAGAGATVCALTRTVREGEPIVLAATALTGPGGEFTLELPPGPSREVFVHYADGDRVVARHGLVLRSVARPRLEAAPATGAENHDRLHFSGSLPRPACAGRLVKVQARIGRRRWQVFRTDRTDGDCHFTARYRLRATRRARHYRFRALVPEQPGYPYEPGYSRTRKVAVEGP